MFVSTAFVVPLLLLVLCNGSYEEECETYMKGSSQELNMKITGKRNDLGKWMSQFTAQKATKWNSSEVDVDVTLRSHDCKGKQIVLIQGVIQEKKKEEEEPLKFYPKCGTNIVIVNEGRSIVKVNSDEFGNDVAMTNRPLKDNEIFEVKLDYRIFKYWYAMGIGVMTHNPKDLELPKHMSHLATGNWMFFHDSLYSHGVQLKANYVPKIDELKAGDRLGVQRTSSGHLHLYVNGVDQGPAISGVPAGVYGVYQLHGNAVAATIVDPK